MSYVEETMTSRKNSTTDPEREGILQKLLKVDKKVAIIMACDSLFAGIDTVSSIIV
jgi:hypothetical protein